MLTFCLIFLDNFKKCWHTDAQTDSGLKRLWGERSHHIWNITWNKTRFLNYFQLVWLESPVPPGIILKCHSHHPPTTLITYNAWVYPAKLRLVWGTGFIFFKWWWREKLPLFYSNLKKIMNRGPGGGHWDIWLKHRWFSVYKLCSPGYLKAGCSFSFSFCVEIKTTNSSLITLTLSTLQVKMLMGTTQIANTLFWTFCLKLIELCME